MKEIEKIREGVYIQKSFGRYKVVYPINNDNGTPNWFNILTGGTWGKLLTTLFVIAIILGVTFSYMHDTKTCREMVSNPCKVFTNLDTYKHYCVYENNPLNITDFWNKDGEIIYGEKEG
jgi:hypothetical protein